MPDYAQAINQHYGQAELSAKILAALREAGKDLEALTRDDLAWTQGVLRNLGDKSRFFAEASRVLRPGGRLAFQASLAGPVPGVYYPTLWADDGQIRRGFRPGHHRSDESGRARRESAPELCRGPCGAGHGGL